MNRVKVVLSVLTLSACAFHSVASTNKNQEIIASKLPSWLESTDTPAAAVAFISNGKLAWTEVAGERAEGLSAGEDTLFNVASLAKPVTAEAVLTLVENGQLKLDDSASSYWIDPDIANSEWVDNLTVSHLLSHQSGFANWRVQTDNKLQFQFEPGTRAGYSGEGYNYLAKITENITNTTFSNVVNKNVISELDGAQLLWAPKGEALKNIAHPKGPEGKYGEPSVKESAADDLYTTIESYGKFATFIMNKYLGDKTVFSERWDIPHNLAGMVCQPERLAEEFCPQQMGFSLGWSVFIYNDRTLYIHGGGDWGERAMVVLSPQDDKGIVVFTNGANGMKVIRKVMATLLDSEELDAFIAMQGG